MKKFNLSEKEICNIFGLNLATSITESIFTKQRRLDICHEKGSFIAFKKSLKVFAKWARIDRLISGEVKRQKIFNKIVNKNIVRAPEFLYSDEKEGYKIYVFEYVDPKSDYFKPESFIKIIISVLSEFKTFFKVNEGTIFRQKTFSNQLDELSRMLACLSEKGDLPLIQQRRYLDYFKSTFRLCDSCFVHGDFVPHNFVVKRKKPFVLYDFEKSARGNYLEDLARLTNFFMVHNPNIYDLLVRNYNKEEKEQLNGYRLFKSIYLSHHYLKKSQKNPKGMAGIQKQLWLKVSERLASKKEKILFEEERRAILEREKEFIKPDRSWKNLAYTH